MAIKQQDTLADLTGLTDLTNGDATWSLVSNRLRATVVTAGNSWSGYRSTAGVTIANGDRLYYSIKKITHNAQAAMVGGKRLTTIVPEANTSFMRVNGTNIEDYLWESHFGTPFAGTLGTEYFFLNVYAATGVLQYYNTTGWSDDIGDWTLYTTSSTTGIDETGQTLRWLCPVLGNAAGDVLEFGPYSFTDSSGGGYPLVSILLDDDFADETGITKVVPSHGTVTNSSGTEIITLSQHTNVLEGFYGNSAVTVAEEDNLYFSFKSTVMDNGAIFVGGSRGLVPDLLTELHYICALANQSTTIKAVLWNSLFGAGFTGANNTRYYFLIMYGSERQALYYNTSGYSDLLADWTLLSTIPEGVADVGQAIRFFAYVSEGDANTEVTVYPYAFRNNSTLVIDNAPIPTGVSATVLSSSSILVNWTDNGALDTETSIKIERSTVGSGSGFSQIASVNRGTTGFVSGGLAPLTEYFYRIRSDFSFGSIHHYSSYTSEVSETTPDNSAAQSGGIVPSFLNRRRRKSHG